MFQTGSFLLIQQVQLYIFIYSTIICNASLILPPNLNELGSILVSYLFCSSVQDIQDVVMKFIICFRPHEKEADP